MFEFLEIIGVAAFAMSGSLTGMHKKFDLFGVFVIAIATSFGGGTLRDILMGEKVFWFKTENLMYIYVAILGYLLAVIFHKKLEYFRISLFLFDTIGLGLYTLVGLEKGLVFGLHPIICVALGTITACFGGVIRDILCAEAPNLFKQEIYATICVAGGILFFILKEINMDNDMLYLVTSLFIIAVRLLAVRYKWQIPPLKIEN